jgi:hypothetical protein
MINILFHRGIFLTMNTMKSQSGHKKSEKIQIEIRELPQHLIDKAVADLLNNRVAPILPLEQTD